MDVSAAEVVLGLVVLTCAVGAVYGARWVSRRSDEQMERTRAALRARHAEPERPPVPSQQVAVPQPARTGEPATRQLSRAESAKPRSRAESAKPRSRAESTGSAPTGSAPTGSESTGSESTGSAPTGSAPGGRPAVPPPGAVAGDPPSVEVADGDPDSSGRHRVPEELMRAATYSLSPDRVARAKVPGPRPRREQDRLTDRRP